MSPQKLKYYVQAMTMIKARERLEHMDASQYPHLQDKERSKRHRAVYKVAYPDNFENRAIKTTDLELF